MDKGPPCSRGEMEVSLACSQQSSQPPTPVLSQMNQLYHPHVPYV